MTIPNRLITERLILRHFCREDLPAFLEMSSDPEVIRYAQNEPLASLEEAWEVMQSATLKDYATHGYGRFAVELVESGQVIGFCGLKYLPEIDETELGYRLLTPYWGQGITTEAGKACIDFARDSLELSHIVSLILAENTASIRVAEKLGLVYENTIEFDGLEALRYVRRFE